MAEDVFLLTSFALLNFSKDLLKILYLKNATIRQS